MPSPRFRVAVQPGDGIVARFGSAVVIADATSEAFTNSILDELDAAGGELSDDLAWRIAARLSADPQDAPAFGLLFATDAGYRVFLHGRARALVNGEPQLAGSSALTWLDAAVTGPVRDVALTLVDEGDVMPDARSDLRGGTMSGVGLVLTPAGAHAAEPPPATAAPKIAPATPPAPPVQPEPEPAPEPDPQPIPPQPPAFAAIAPVPIPLEKPYVPEPEPVRTPPPHDPPTAVIEPVAEPAPDSAPNSVAALMSDEGVRTPLDRSYVFGREPQQDRAVQDGHAAPIRLTDHEQLISRVQAYLYVNGERVTVQDARSANGTFIAAPGAADWVRLGEEPADLPIGWSIRMGRRVFTHFGANV